MNEVSRLFRKLQILTTLLNPDVMQSIAFEERRREALNEKSRELNRRLVEFQNAVLQFLPRE
jgi:hypothetical protein